MMLKSKKSKVYKKDMNMENIELENSNRLNCAHQLPQIILVIGILFYFSDLLFHGLIFKNFLIV